MKAAAARVDVSVSRAVLVTRTMAGAIARGALSTVMV